MYLAEAEEIFDHWQESPPTYQAVGLIARMLGWEPKPASDGADAAALAEMPFDFELPVEIAEQLGRDVGGEPVVFSLGAMREKNRQRAAEIARRNMTELEQLG